MKKKFLIISAFAAIVAGTFMGCSKSQFDSKFFDPEKTTVGNIDGLYSSMFMNRRIFPTYWDVYTNLYEICGRYMLTVGFQNGPKMWEPNPSWVSDRWSDFYTYSGSDNWTAPLADFRTMERLYGDLKTDEEKQGYLLFMETARVVLYDQATQLVDLFGDIPLTEAGQLDLNNTMKLPKFDEARSVYDSAFSNLLRISSYLATVQPLAFYASKLGKQDLMFRGDLQKWRRYTNSLILRLAMRISTRDEERAKSIVQQILSNPTLYPTIDAVEDNAQVAAGKPSLATDINNGFTENAHDLAPGYMVDSLLKPTADPRLRIFFTLNKAGQYQGMNTSWTGQQQTDAIQNGTVSRVDTTTFLKNEFFPGIVFTSAETWFIKAEALLRWNIGSGTARAAYENGIKQSITYYFNIHNLSEWNNKIHETMWTNPEITLLVTNPKVQFTGVLDDDLNKLFLQKWLDYGFMRSPQAWAEQRRSGYPKLPYPVDNGSAILKTPPVRLLYPSSERALNAKNYAEISDKDTYQTKLFWAK